MTAHCHQHQQAIEAIPAYLTNDFFSYDGIVLILTLFLTGLAGSFTHCIGMCGPIAAAQMSVRLMTIPNQKMSEWSKVKIAFLAPYYFGKALTYCLTLTTLFLLKYYITINSFNLKYLAASLLLFIAFLFLKSALDSKSNFLDASKIKPLRFLNNVLVNRFAKLQFNSYGIRGMLLGMVLGLLPCGLVYANIAAIIARTGNLILANFAMFAFAIATIPGLFVVAYLGQQLFIKWRKFFKVFYIIMMVINAWLLVKMALMML
jgi:sulfite exporter TauE/SafE